MFWRINEGDDDMGQPCFFILEANDEADAKDEYEDYMEVGPPVSVEPITFYEINLHDYMSEEVRQKWQDWKREQAELAAHPTLF